MFAAALTALGGRRNWLPVILALKAYLDDLGFAGLYKYLVTARQYHWNPSFMSRSNLSFLNSLPSLKGEGFPDWTLARCLTAHQICDISDLTPSERELAGSLAGLGMVKVAEGQLHPGDFQLVCVADRYLLLDAGIHFPLRRDHEIYLGSDSLLLIEYLGTARRVGKALDLCCGTGVIGLAMARVADAVVSTDISPAALALSRVNAALNSLEERIEIRDESLGASLSSGERYDLVACNPPFVRLPSEFNPPLFAAGTGADGLDYMRQLLNKVPSMLNPGGEAVFVADLPGDGREPHFFGELENMARSQGLRIDAYVDSRIDATYQVGTLTDYFAGLNPDIRKEDIQNRLNRLIRDELRATQYYLTNLRIRKFPVGELRRLNRYAPRTLEGILRL